jgi:hypothetical protein
MPMVACTKASKFVEEIMEDQMTRLRLNLVAREIEIEGSESFVREYADKFSGILDSIIAKNIDTAAQQQAPPLAEQDVDLGESPVVQLSGVPATFGEYMSFFPTDIKDVDKMLITCYYTQARDENNSFTTAAANALLKEQGIKLANASNCVTHNLQKKNVFRLEKGQFRVSQSGVERINGLLTH